VRSGTVRTDGPGRFITTIDLSGHLIWIGDQLRLFTVDGDCPTIRTPEQTVAASQWPYDGIEMSLERERY
jgi:hypothetical protein